MAETLKVGIAFNLKKGLPVGPPDAEAEFDDPDTVRAIQSALETAGCRVELFEADDSFPGRIAEAKPDIVFNIAEGRSGRGRESHVPAILRFLDIPFVGSDETSMCIAMDKALTKRLLASWGIRTPKYAVIGKDTRYTADDGTGIAGYTGSWPIIVKPNAEGSGKGISGVSVVSSAAGLREAVENIVNTYEQDALIEEYIQGREFTVGLLGNGKGQRIFPPMEIIFNAGDRGIYSYEVKRDFKRYVSYACPPDVGADILAELESTARDIFRIIGCRDFARIDFRLSREGELHFIEINPLPGLAPGYSDYPMLAGFCGVDYDALIAGVLQSALARYGMAHRLDLR